MVKICEYKKIENIRFYSESIRDMEFIDCIFENCFFEECYLENVNLIDCKIHNSTFINLRGDDYTFIQNIEIDNCNLIGINWNEFISKQILLDSIKNIKNSTLKYNSFIDISLKKFNFISNKILNSIFSQCNLKDSNFRDCKLEYTEFFKTNIERVDFRDSTGYVIDVLTCKVKGAKFSTPDVLKLLNQFDIEIY